MAKEIVKEEPKEELKQVEATLMIESTKPAFKLPDGEIVEVNELLVWMANKIYEMSKKL